MHLFDPESKGVDDQLFSNRVIAVKGVSATCVVIIKLTRSVRSGEVVIRRVVDPFKAKCWTLMIAFVCVVVDNVKDHFDSCLMQGLYHVSEFIEMLACVWVDAISLMWGEVTHRAVTPVIHQFASFVDLGDIGMVKTANG